MAQEKVVEARAALEAAKATGQEMTSAGIEHIGTHVELARNHKMLTGLAQFYYAALAADGYGEPLCPIPRSVAAILPLVFDDKSSAKLPHTHTQAMEEDQNCDSCLCVLLGSFKFFFELSYQSQ